MSRKNYALHNFFLKLFIFGVGRIKFECNLFAFVWYSPRHSGDLFDLLYVFFGSCRNPASIGLSYVLPFGRNDGKQRPKNIQIDGYTHIKKLGYAARKEFPPVLILSGITRVYKYIRLIEVMNKEIPDLYNKISMLWSLEGGIMDNYILKTEITKGGIL